MYIEIKVGAVTNAQRGAKILRRNGLKPTISRIENPKAGDGCGFVLSVDEQERELALQLLKKFGVRILGVEQN